MRKTLASLNRMIRAGYPLLYILSFEERRVENSLHNQAGNKTLLTWTVTRGFRDVVAQQDVGGTEKPMAALDYVLQNERGCLFLLKDFHPYFEDPLVIRKLRDCVERLITSGSSLLFLSPILKLPPELERQITVVDFPLPTREELLSEVKLFTEAYKDQIIIDTRPAFQALLLDALAGLTILEAQNIIAAALVTNARLDAGHLDEILLEKAQIVRKSGVLEYLPVEESFANIGGLQKLKDWLKRKAVSFDPKAKEFGLCPPKGLLLAGVSGCGKSLTAKAIAHEWKLPLLKFDLGKIFAMYVGQSEENVRRALATAEAMAPCVLWIDEIEKGFAGIAEGGDSGVSARVFGTFITWLQEKQASVFVVATANDVTHLPPELLRKGRFDELFFVDLPTIEERVQIFAVMLKRINRKAEDFDLLQLAQATVGFSGADIEQVVKSGLETAFLDGERTLSTEDVLAQIAQTIPLSVTMRDRIEVVRQWAKGGLRCV